jgi:hypothetical protein
MERTDDEQGEDALMAVWIESHAEIWEHHKLDALVAKLEGELPAGLDPDEKRVLLVGHLHSLWHFAVRNAWRDGDLTKWGIGGIERAARWRRPPGVLFAALKAVGFIDAGPKDTIHDWLDFAGQLVKKRIDREAQRSARMAAGGYQDEGKPQENAGQDSTGNRAGTDQEPTSGLPYRTDRTEPDRPDRTKEKKARPAKRAEPAPLDPSKLKSPRAQAAAQALLKCQKIKIANPGVIDLWAEAYPDVSLARCVIAAEAWATTKKVTRSPAGWERCLNTWISKEQDRAKAAPGRQDAMKPQAHGGKYAAVEGRNG